MRGMHSANGGQMGAEAETGSLGNTVFTSAGFTPASTIAHTQCGACASPAWCHGLRTSDKWSAIGPELAVQRKS